MGNQTTTFNHFPVVKAGGPPEWRKEGTTGYCDIVRHVSQNFVAEEYTFQRDGRISLLEDCQRYEWRRNQPEYIIQVYQVEKQPRQYLCQGEQTIKVRTERIPQRLFDRNNLVQQQALAILSQSLSGFAIIRQLHGRININDQLIGFTPEGKVKVWLNENIARNLPNRQSQIFESRRRVLENAGEDIMVRQIFEVVQGHVRGGSFEPDLREAFNGIKTFRQAIKYVEQYRTSAAIEVKSIISEQPKMLEVQNIQVVNPQQTTIPHNVTQFVQIPQNMQIRQSAVGQVSRVIQVPQNIQLPQAIQVPQPAAINFNTQPPNFTPKPVNLIPQQNFVKATNQQSSQLRIAQKPASRNNVFFQPSARKSQVVNNKSSRNIFPVATINRGNSHSLMPKNTPSLQARNLTAPKQSSRINKSVDIPQVATKQLNFNKSFDTQGLNRKMFDFNSASSNLTSLANLPPRPTQSALTKPINFTYQKAVPKNSIFNGLMKNTVTEASKAQPTTNIVDDVTPETLFEPRPPSSERKQIKIVYESQQLDAYTLDNLARQSPKKSSQQQATQKVQQINHNQQVQQAVQQPLMNQKPQQPPIQPLVRQPEQPTVQQTKAQQPPTQPSDQQQLRDQLQRQIQQLQAKKIRIQQAQQVQELARRQIQQSQTVQHTVAQDHSQRLVQLQHQFGGHTTQHAQQSNNENQINNKNSPVNVLTNWQTQQQKPQQPTVRFQEKIRYEQPPIQLQQQYLSELEKFQERQKAVEVSFQQAPQKLIHPIVETVSQESINKEPALIQKDVELIEQNGKAMGFEIVETDVYYTAGGEKVTVEEDYEVIYKDNGEVEVVDLDEQYPPQNLRDVHHIPIEETQQSPQKQKKNTVNYSPGLINIPKPTVYEELDSVSPIGLLTNVAKSQKSSFQDVRETTNHYTLDYGSSLKYSSGLASSQGIMNDLREDISAHGSVVRSAQVPTYENLRSNIIQNYSNIKPNYSSSMQQVVYRT